MTMSDEFIKDPWNLDSAKYLPTTYLSGIDRDQESSGTGTGTGIRKVRDRDRDQKSVGPGPGPGPDLNNTASACQKNRFFRRFFVTKI